MKLYIIIMTIVDTVVPVSRCRLCRLSNGLSRCA